jgi:hypothetical protein
MKMMRGLPAKERGSDNAVVIVPTWSKEELYWTGRQYNNIEITMTDITILKKA